MKLQNLLEGMWVIKNLDGKEKRFKDDQSASAIEWKNSHTPKTQRQLDAEREKYWRDLDKAAKVKKPTLDEIYSRVETEVGNSFPDGDPIDRLRDWMRKFEVTMDDIDRAFKKNAKSDFHTYLGNMWEGMAQDAFHDAYTEYHKHGREPDDGYNPYWSMGKNGPELHDNPWLTREQQKKARKDL
jgi:hypothetical protein